MSDTPDEFADTFAQLAAELNKPEAPAPVAAAAPEPVAPLPVVPADPAAPVAEAPAEPVAADPAAPVVAEVPAPAPAPAPADAPAKVGISDDELRKMVADLAASRSQPPQPEPERQAPPAPTPPPMFTDDEQKFLASYEKDWPDVARAEALRRRADLQSVVSYMFQEIAKEFGPVAQSAKQLSERQQIMELRSHVPDYDKIYEPIIGWVQTQPPIIRSHLEGIVKGGTAQDVLSLIDTWRSSQGQSAPAVVPAPVPAAKPALSPAVQKAVAALAPVSGKRSTVARGQTEGFDDTWEEILKAG